MAAPRDPLVVLSTAWAPHSWPVSPRSSLERISMPRMDPSTRHPTWPVTKSTSFTAPRIRQWIVRTASRLSNIMRTTWQNRIFLRNSPSPPNTVRYVPKRIFWLLHRRDANESICWYHKSQQITLEEHAEDRIRTTTSTTVITKAHTWRWTTFTEVHCCPESRASSIICSNLIRPNFLAVGPPALRWDQQATSTSPPNARIRQDSVSFTSPFTVASRAGKSF